MTQYYLVWGSLPHTAEIRNAETGEIFALVKDAAISITPQKVTMTFDVVNENKTLRFDPSSRTVIADTVFPAVIVFDADFDNYVVEEEPSLHSAEESPSITEQPAI